MFIIFLLSGSIAGFLLFVLAPYTLLYFNDFYQLPFFHHPILTGFGIVLMLSGIALFVYCTNIFLLIGHGTPAPLAPPKKLVVKGLYQQTRNPIYIGYILILFGEFLFFGRLLLLVYAIVSSAFIHAFVVRFEEPRLKKRFGKEYEEYMKCVPRWI